MSEKLYEEIIYKLDSLNNELCNDNIDIVKTSENKLTDYILVISLILILIGLVYVFVKYVNLKYSKNELDDIPVPKTVIKSVPEKIPIVKPKPKVMRKQITKPKQIIKPKPEVKEIPKELPKELPKETPKETPKEIPKELPKEIYEEVENVEKDDDFTFCYYNINSNDDICYVF